MPSKEHIVTLSSGLSIEGPPLTGRVEVRTAGDVTDVTFAEAPEDAEQTPLLVASWKNGQLHGKLKWHVERHIMFDKPIVAFGDKRLLPRDLPRRPNTAMVEAEFEGGERVGLRCFDEGGDELLQPLSIRDWRQTIDAKEIPGYVTRGDFAADLRSFFPHCSRVTKLSDHAPLELASFVERLPEKHRPALVAFDALVRSWTFPALVLCDVSAYGFDCQTNELYGADDDRYVGIAAENSGDMFLLDLDNGKVLEYSHEEGIFSERGTFEDLDTFAFTMIRVEAARDKEKQIDKSELARVFEQLGLSVGLRWLSSWRMA
jgi:hypothetical protein